MSVEVWPFTHVVQRNVNFDESQSFTYLYYNVIVYKMKYDLKGHGRSNKAFVANFFFIAEFFITGFNKNSNDTI